MTIISETYDKTRLPTLTLSVNTESLAVSAQCEILGIDPVRTVSADEQLDGIISISVPEVEVYGDIQSCLNLLIRACLSGIHETDGFELSPELLGQVVYSVTWSFRAAERAVAARLTANDALNVGIVV